MKLASDTVIAFLEEGSQKKKLEGRDDASDIMVEILMNFLNQ